MNSKGSDARKGALFFCITFSLMALLGIILATTSCSHSGSQQKGPDDTPAATEVMTNSGTEPAPPVSSGETYDTRSLEEIDAELARMRTENSILKEENFWLRSRLIKTQQSLAEANDRIYSLNQKLHAIFNPNNVGE